MLHNKKEELKIMAVFGSDKSVDVRMVALTNQIIENQYKIKALNFC